MLLCKKLSRALLIAAAVGLTPAALGQTKLNNNQAVTLNAAEGAQLKYKFWVPTTKTQVLIKISGGSGDADMFIRRGSQPTFITWDFRPFLVGNNEQVTINNPTPSTSGTWYYIMVHAFEAISNVTLLAQYQNDPRMAGNGGLLKNLADPEDAYRHAHIDVPPGATKLIIKTSGGTGDMDLYVNFSLPADEDRWDYRPFKVGNNETVTVNNPAAGTWWIMMHSYATYGGVKLTAEYEGLTKYRANRLASTDTATDVNFTNSPGTSWRYGNWGGPTWTGHKELRLNLWNGTFNAPPADAMDDLFREHDADIKAAGSNNAAKNVADDDLLDALNALPSGANGSNHVVWGQIYLASPAGAPASITIKPGSPVALPQIIMTPTPMPYSEYARRQAKLGLTAGWFTE